MDAQIGALTVRVARQDERIAQLERRLNRSSRNSSVPPSADPSASTPKKRGKDPSGRRQGAQPGHEGKGRPLLPAWAVDGVIEYWPERCGCGHAFALEERVAVGEPVRWQVEELPVISVQITEHQCYRVCCPDCGRRRRAELPPHISPRVLSVRAFRRPSRRSAPETASLAVMSWSSASSCSPRESAQGQRTRSSPVPARRWLNPTPICWQRFVVGAQ